MICDWQIGLGGAAVILAAACAAHWLRSRSHSWRLSCARAEAEARTAALAFPDKPRVPRYELNGMPRTYRPSKGEAAVAFQDEPSWQAAEAADRLAREARDRRRAEFVAKYLRQG
jgi:hypothetical protein